MATMDQVILRVTPRPSQLDVGQTVKLYVSTTPSTANVTITSTKPDIVSVDAANKTIKGLSLGTAIVRVVAEISGFETNETDFIVTVLNSAAEDVAKKTSISMYDPATSRTVRIETASSDVSRDDVVIQLPGKSGTVATNEQINSIFTVINKPVITSPTNGDDNYKGLIISSEFEETGGYIGIHTKTEWETCLTRDPLKTPILTKVKTSGDLTRTGIGYVTESISVRVRYWSGSYVSEWSDYVECTPKDFGVDGQNLETVKGGNGFAGYMGEVPFDQLIGDRNYRGEFDSIRTNLKDVYTTNNRLVMYNKGDIVKAAVYNASNQPTTEFKAYYAKRDIPTTEVTDAVAKQPSKNTNDWAEDTRDNLPTMEWLLKHVGLGTNLNDGSIDGYSLPSTPKIGNIVNDDNGWLKCNILGTIFYVAKKNAVNEIAWNDLAKRELTHGKRTVRIGSRLYFIRLLTEDEFNKIIRPLVNQQGGEAELWDDFYSSDEALTRADTDFSDETKLSFIMDNSEGGERKAVRFDGTSDIVIRSIDPKSRTGSYRPVLELIPKGDEPFVSPQKGPAGENEELNMDHFTDTGYFGKVPAASLFTAEQLVSKTGFTPGVIQNNNADWYKFYWHGMIVYIASRCMKHSVSYNDLKQNNMIWGIDLGGSGKTIVKQEILTDNGLGEMEKETKYYRLLIPSVCKSSPFHISGVAIPSIATSYSKEVMEYSPAKGSMWHELMLRLDGAYNGKGADDDGWEGDYGQYNTGEQIGNDWADYSVSDMGVTTATGFGAQTIGQEVGANVNAPANPRIACAGGFSAATWKGTTADVSPTVATSEKGWRPVLILQ